MEGDLSRDLALVWGAPEGSDRVRHSALPSRTSQGRRRRRSHPPTGSTGSRNASRRPMSLTNRHHFRSAQFVDRFGATVRCVREGMREFQRGEPVEPFVRHPIPGYSPTGSGRSARTDGAARTGSRGAHARGRSGALGAGRALVFVPDKFLVEPATTKEGLREAYRPRDARLQAPPARPRRALRRYGLGRARRVRRLGEGGRRAHRASRRPLVFGHLDSFERQLGDQDKKRLKDPRGPPPRAS